MTPEEKAEKWLTRNVSALLNDSLSIKHYSDLYGTELITIIAEKAYLAGYADGNEAGYRCGLEFIGDRLKHYLEEGEKK